MRTKLAIVLALTFAGCALAQQRPAVPDGLPWPSGVYFQAGTNWVALTGSPLMPFLDGDLRWLLWYGHGDAVAEMPGAHALAQLSAAKPVFYLRGIPATSGIRLVRVQEKDDYRLLKMPVNRDFHEFTRFRRQDLIDLDVRQVSGDVVQATPRGELKPGEYAIVSQFEQNMRQIRASFEFGIAAR
jgi:hypothetical protein